MTTNGVQQLGKDLQIAGGVTPSTPTSPNLGMGISIAGRAIEKAGPAGTIDGDMTVRITGNGNVQYVGGSVKDFPSYAMYTYYC